MRKSLISAAGDVAPAAADWLDVEDIARVEVSSEDAAFPAESVFSHQASSGWRADAPGEQTLRLVFDNPQVLKRIQLVFDEPTCERTQQFTLSWLASGGARTEIARQQWNFTPGGSIQEVEDFRVDLPDVSALELQLKPSLDAGQGLACLTSWRVA